MIRLIAIHAIIQPWGLLILPMSLLAALPFAWVYAFYQNVSVLGYSEEEDIKIIIKRSRRQAALWPAQNHILLSILCLLGVFVFVNLAITIFLLPQLLKMLLGIETFFTKSAWSILNTTFLATTCAVTYLCMDPLIKTVYVLRCFYGDSLRSGADLRIELKPFLEPKRIGASLVILGLFFQSVIPCEIALAAKHISLTPLHSDPQKLNVSSAELDHSISEIIQQRQYNWRMPREKIRREEVRDKGVLAVLVEGIGDTLKSWFKTVIGWLERLTQQMDKVLRKLIQDHSEESQSGIQWTTFIKSLTVFLLVLLIGTLVVLFWRMWQRRRKQDIEVSGKPISAEPDLTDERIVADELPADRWLLLAQELMEKGDLRSALRALYLASLVALAQHELITIAKFKSNCDYEQELNRRARERPDLLEAFAENVTLFDRAWYGKYRVTPEDTDYFAKNQERIMACIEE
jgi:hypothetical protein